MIKTVDKTLLSLSQGQREDTASNQAQYLKKTLDLQLSLRMGELNYQLYHDRLTGLKNRYALDKDLEENFSTVLLVDIDQFHNYNELYGLEVGNEVLKNFGTFIARFAQRHAYEAYRVYGDGFILKSKEAFCSHDVIHHDIVDFLEELSQYQVILELEGEEIEIEIDVTIAISMEKEYTLEKANSALKHARSEQKSYLAYYKAINTEKKLKDALYWRKEIKEALKEDRIVPVFQPIVDKNGDIHKYEVLTRLQKEGENISPFYFLDIAIKTKQYAGITHRMIEKSFKIMQALKVDFSINLLFADIKNRKTMQFLKEQIVQYDIGDRLVLEIVESEDINDYLLLSEVIGKFRELGVRIAIDDFGSGFSNYAYILEIAPDYLKIDGSLIKDLGSDVKAYKLVNSIQILASSLGIKTIAEYIHSKEVFEATKQLKIDEFQGFYFSKPIDAEALMEKEAALV